MGWQRWWFAVPMVVVLSAGVSLMRVTMQEQVVALACSEARRTEPDLHCDAESVINEANKWSQAGQLGFGLSSLVTASLWGSLSDRFGRKVVMLVSTLGNLLIAVCAACIGTDTEYPWRTVLTMASVVGGLGGGTTITLLGAFAYLADCCPPKDRALSFTLIEAFYGVGSLAAYFGGGYISKDRGETATLLIVAAWLGAVCLYIVVIPESITPEKQVALQWRKLHSLQALVGFVKTGPNDLPGARLTRCALAAAFVTAFLGFLGGFSVTTLFFKGARYHWDDGKIGIYNGVCQAGRSFTVFLAPTIEWLSPSDRQKRGLVQVFLVVFAACNIATPWARPPGTVYALGGVAGLVLPTCFGYLRSMVSRAFADEAQGEGLAGLAFIEGLDTLLSALIFNSVFDVHARGLPDGSAAWFAIGASAVLASATLFAVFPSPNELVVAKIPTGASGRGVPGSDGEETPLLGPSDNTLVN